MIQFVFEPGIIQGRFIGEAEIAQVRGLIAENGQWSRRRISEHLTEQWDWRRASGQLKDMAARTLLLKLEACGWITLPARRRAPSNRMKNKVRMPGETNGERGQAVCATLPELFPLRIEEISRKLHSTNSSKTAFHRWSAKTRSKKPAGKNRTQARRPVGSSRQHAQASGKSRPHANPSFGSLSCPPFRHRVDQPE